MSEEAKPSEGDLAIRKTLSDLYDRAFATGYHQGYFDSAMGEPEAVKSKPATARINLTFQIVESHTFEREVNIDDFVRERQEDHLMDWLEAQFRDDPMSDSDINTESVKLLSWSLVKPQEGGAK